MLEKYYAGTSSVEEESQLEAYLQKPDIPEEFYAAREEFFYYGKFRNEEAPLSLETKLLDEIATKRKPGGKILNWFSPTGIAAAIAFLVVGFGIGRFSIEDSKEPTEVDALREEVAHIKQIMALSLLEQNSVHDRLKAVAMAADLDTNQDIITALIKTMNTDSNVNIRLASIEALSKFLDQDVVVQSMIDALAKQQSLPVRLELARIMIANREKASLPILEEIIKDGSLDAQVKEDITKGIQTITTGI